MKKIVGMVVVGALAVAACSGGDASVTIDDAWGRTSTMDVANGAFYMTIHGGSADDTLVSVATEACGMAELHESVMQDDMMSMQELAGGIDIPADGEVALEPGGMHVMCMNKKGEFAAGDTVELELEFENAGAMTVSAEIRDQ